MAAADQLEEALSSPTFKFFIGPERKLFYVHSDAIRKNSQPLRALMEQPMLEAQTGEAELSDIEPQTFFKVCQFMYTGDYDTPMPEGVKEPPAADEMSTGFGSWGFQSSARTSEEVWSTGGKRRVGAGSVRRPSGGKKGMKGRKGVSSSSMESRDRPGSGSSERLREVTYGHPGDRTFQPKRNNAPSEDYTRVFLCHAQLYVFGDKYDISSLRELSLYKLHQTLVVFTPYADRFGDILGLVRYIYENTREEDDLRRMIAHYVVNIIEDLAKNDDFQHPLAEYAALSKDVILRMFKGSTSLGGFDRI
ncbi:hypothetical protein FQN54_002814 [Arachnomyces sp. PD_36]|nr:hypothetical protein FQN54_002814 [Arachnomyces sp. PD_36]